MPVLRSFIMALILIGGVGGCTVGAPVPVPDATIGVARPGVRNAGTSADCLTLARDALHSGEGRSGLVLAADEPGRIVNDLRLPTGDAAVGCVLVVGRLQPAPPLSRQEIGIERRASSYVAGTQRRANPRYRELARALAAAERPPPASATHIMATGEPLADLVGSAAELALTAVDGLYRSRRASSLRQELEATPEELEQPRRHPYAYEALVVDAERRSAVTASFIADGITLRTVETGPTQRLRWRIEPGRRADDASAPPSDSLPSLDALSAWEAAGADVKVSWVLARLLDPFEAPGVPLAPPPPPTAAAGVNATTLPQPGAVVRLQGAGGSTLGIRIAPSMAVAFSASLGDSSLLRVEDEHRTRAFALVSYRDTGNGLVAVELPTAGPPAKLAEPMAGPASVLVLVAGTPASRPGRLVATKGGELAWWSAAAGAAPVGSPIMDTEGSIVGVLGEPAGRVLPAGVLSAVANATR